MKKFRGILATPVIGLATVLYGLASLLISFFDRKKNGFAQHAVAQAWARMLIRLSGIRVYVEGLERIEPGKSYVFISNHLSYADTPVVLAFIPVQFRFLAKKGLFQIPFLGTHLHRAGHIRVPRGDPRAAVKTLQLAAEIIQQKQISLLVFPEGGRSPHGKLRAFREGGAYMAIKSGVPLVPLVLLGTAEVLPFGSALIRPGAVTLRILDPIPTSSFTLRDRGELTERLHALIATELGEQPQTEPAQPAAVS